ncbi:hypothetical protein AGMMS50289_22730 [Betaproteobacteria bacterium]|nr:hypothetical protein AGMMS50289_22730 [Betaproteobacteria bacterium]
MPSEGATPEPVSEQVRDWDKPTDPRELEAYNFAHSLELPDSLPKLVPFDFNKYARSDRSTIAKAYFKHLCETEAGDYVFKTIEKVEGLYQMRPRKKATEEEFRDLYRMEDPYGYVNGETEDVPFMFLRKHRYRYFEQAAPGSFVDMEGTYRKYYDDSLFLLSDIDDAFVIFWTENERENRSLRKRYEKNRTYRYGYTWRGIYRVRDREFGIAGSELIVLDLQTNEILGVRRGFALTGFRRPNWEFTPVCPRYEIRHRSKDFDFSYWFIRKVLRPVDPVEWPDVTF